MLYFYLTKTKVDIINCACKLPNVIFYQYFGYLCSMTHPVHQTLYVLVISLRTPYSWYLSTKL